VQFLARESINVCAGESASAGDRVAERIVPITGGKSLAAVNQEGDITIPISLIEIVRRPVPAGVTRGPAQQAANAAGAFHCAAQVQTPGVTHRQSIIPIPLLDDAIAI